MRIHTLPRARGAFSFLVLLSLFCALPASAQSVGTVQGTVTDADLRLPLPGVNILIEGTRLGATTDVDGRYSVSVPAGDYTLVASFVGYSTLRTPISVPATESVNVDIELREDALQLDDLVVTGYSNRERRNLATAISSIDGSEIEDLPSASVDGALQGRSAGVTVLRSSGTPGGGISVRIRGATSISGSNEPLYIVDGIPITTGDFSALGVGNQGSNALASISTQDIESIELLKDAASTAIYGTRAANGVVIITTKRGRAGQTRINFDTSVGSSSIPGTYDPLNSAEYIGIRNEGVRNQGFDVNLPDNFFNGGFFPGTRELPFGDPTAFEGGSNFYDEVRQTGLVQNYRIGLNGGTENTRFLVSGNYSNEEGALVSSGFERFNGRVNVDHTPNDKALLQASISYNRGISDRIENDNNIFGVLTNALISPPTVLTRDSEGNLTPGGQFAFDNPVGASQVFQESVDTKFLGSLVGSYEILPGLRARVQAGLDRFDFKDDQYSPSFTRQGAPSGAGFSSVGIQQRYILESTLNYRRLFADVHDLSLVAGGSYEDSKYEQTFSSSTDYATDLLQRVSEGATTTGGSGGTTSSLLSSFGNVDYSFDGRYLFTLNARLDGSSRFGEDNRFAFFPGLAVGWNVHEEAFLENSSFLNQLKLRGSVGQTGQQEIGNFSSLGLFNFGAAYGALPAATASQLANPDLKWETTLQAGGGIDFGILGSRISGSIDGYYKGTDDLLLFRPLPAQTGFTGITSNVGSIENVGIEFQLTTQNIRTRNFRWETTLNLSRNENKITALSDDNPFASGFGSRVAVGQPLGVFYGFRTDGLILNADDICADDTGGTCEAGAPYQEEDTAVGDVRFLDIGRPCTAQEIEDEVCSLDGNIAEADGIVDDADLTYIGDPNPDLFGGFTNSITLFGFEVSAFLQFSLGNDVFNAVRQFSQDVGAGNTRLSFGTDRRILDRVQFDEDGNVTNPDAQFPRATYNDPNDNDRDSDIFVEDGSYIRMKTLTVGYNVPARFLRSVGARSLRIYGLAENLFTVTDYTGLDPEVSTFDGSNTAFGTDFFTYPQTQKFIIGVNVGI